MIIRCIVPHFPILVNRCIIQHMQTTNHNQPHGFLLINKPTGPTSHDIIDQLRKITGIKKIGHAGTLDPFATGLLLVAIGKQATKQIQQFVGLDKEYEATLKLGAVSDTYDRDGKITAQTEVRLQGSEVRLRIIHEALQKFTGPQKQIPPMFSAKKVKGKKLYELARKGIEIKREPQKITIHKIELLNYQWPLLKIDVHCSSGTYIRTLAHDIGQTLNTGAYLQELKRTKIGKFALEQAITVQELTANDWWEKTTDIG